MLAARHAVPAFALALALASVGLASDGVVSIGAAQDDGFATTERVALDAGRLVMRRRTERRGSLTYFGGTSYQRVDRPIEEVWRAVREPSNYRVLLPRVDSVRAVARGEHSVVVRLEHSYSFVRAVYHLRMVYDDARHDVTFDLDPRRPNDVRAARGFLTLSRWPDDPDRTLVSWGILAAVDDGLVGDLVRPQLHDWMLRVPSTMRRYLHGAGRELFVAGVERGSSRVH